MRIAILSLLLLISYLCKSQLLEKESGSSNEMYELVDTLLFFDTEEFDFEEFDNVMNSFDFDLSEVELLLTGLENELASLDKILGNVDELSQYNIPDQSILTSAVANKLIEDFKPPSTYSLVKHDMESSIRVFDDHRRETETLKENKNALLFLSLPEDEKVRIYEQLPHKLKYKDKTDHDWKIINGLAKPEYQRAIRSLASKSEPISFVEAGAEKTATEAIKYNLGKIIQDRVYSFPVPVPSMIAEAFFNSEEVGDQEVTNEDTFMRYLQLKQFEIDKKRAEDRKKEYELIKQARNFHIRMKEILEKEKEKKRLESLGLDPRNSPEANEAYEKMIEHLKDLKKSKQNYRFPAIHPGDD